MLGAMDLGIANDSERARHEQAAQPTRFTGGIRHLLPDRDQTHESYSRELEGRMF
jgi:hypothetical protein